jgi:mannose-1-phosphate guanylyltransferase
MKTVILAAGFGSRLWPLSTSEKPKQFQPLINNESLLCYTYNLLRKVTDADELYVLTLQGLEQHVYAELPAIAENHVILVPERRNTLPHTLWALNILGAEDAEEPILFKSVDHFVVDPHKFLDSLSSSLPDLSKRPLRELTLLCVKADTYSSNCGYAVVDEHMCIVQFKEKPSEEAFRLLQQQGVMYSSPFIYACSKATMSGILMQNKTPLTVQAARLLGAAASERQEAFAVMPFVDISHALFQLAIDMRARAIEYDFVDVGRYTTLYELGSKDEFGNVVQGNVVLGNGCRDNFIVNQTKLPLIVNALNKTVIVQADAGSVVAPIQDIDAVGELYKTKVYGR